MADEKDQRAGELTTVNYGWVKPTVGSSVDAWGGYINSDLDGIDSTVKSVSNTAAAAYPATNPAGYITASSIPAPYVLPTASTTVLGGVKVDGTTVTATAGGVISAAVHVANFGAVGDGVADDTTAIQAAINSLPNDGGIVHFSAGKNYKITSALFIGNGTTSALSTKRGVILRGDGVPNTPTGLPSLNGYTAAAGPKLTWAGGASVMIKVNGPLQGWGVQNLFLDGASIAGVYGLVVSSASFGDCSNLTVQNCATVGIFSSANPIGGYTGVGNIDALRNNWTNIFVYVPAIAGAKGIFLDGDHGGTSNTDYNVFTNVFIRSGGSANNFGLYLGVCDSNAFNMLSISGFAAGTGMQFDYSLNSNFPLSNQFYSYEIGGATPFAVLGSPSTFALTALNRFFGWMQANGAPAPNVIAAEVNTSGINDNRIINGDMRIDQRNNGASGSAAGYTVDRWSYGAAQTSKGAWGRQPSAAMAQYGFPYVLMFTSSSAYTPLAADNFSFGQPIEADMVSDFAWGTPNAQPVTLSFWAISNQTGAFSGSIKNYVTTTRSYPFSFSIPVASTWTRIVVTIPGDTAGTWVMSGNVGAMYVQFDLGSGANFRGPANAWASANYIGVTGAVSIVAVNAAFIQITGVKLEIGSVATPYNRQSLAKSMADCQRYYVQPSTQFQIQGWFTAGASAQFSWSAPVTMRANPTIVASFVGLANCTPTGTPFVNQNDARTIVGNVVVTAVGAFYGQMLITSLSAEL